MRSQLPSAPYDAEIKPNPNDINAPSKNDIEGFKASKAVTWDPEDEARFADWSHFDKQIWYGSEGSHIAPHLHCYATL